MKQFFSNLWKALFGKKQPKPQDPKPPEVVNPKPQEPFGPHNVTINSIAIMIFEEFKPYFGAKENGSNTDKGGPIDMIIKYMDGKLGWAWCAATVSYGALRACEKLGIPYPKGLYRGFSSQSMWHESAKQYIIYNPPIGFDLTGYAFVATNPNDKAHGHTGYCNGIIGKDWMVKTFEGNDGDKLKEDLRDVRRASAFVNVAQAILDQYIATNKGKF